MCTTQKPPLSLLVHPLGLCICAQHACTAYTTQHCNSQLCPSLCMHAVLALLVSVWPSRLSTPINALGRRKGEWSMIRLHFQIVSLLLFMQTVRELLCSIRQPNREVKAFLSHVVWTAGQEVLVDDHQQIKYNWRSTYNCTPQIMNTTALQLILCAQLQTLLIGQGVAI